MVRKEISHFAPDWLDLEKIQDSHVCCHTLNVLYLVMRHPDFLRQSKFEQIVLKWSALLHDIKKLGPPVQEGKDHLHPFKGGLAVLKMFI